MPRPGKFWLRLGIYGAVVVYLICDVRFCDGPLSRRIRKPDPNSRQAVATAKAEGIVARVNGYHIHRSQLERAVQERLWLEGRTLADISPQEAKLVRYADYFVVLARYIDQRITTWIEASIEGRMGLEINRDKTKVVHLTKGDKLDFLGYSFRFDKDRCGRAHKYLNLFPSEKAMARERENLREMTSPRVCFKPLPDLLRQVNRHLRGWSNYFGQGYPRKAFREINSFARKRLTHHMKRRSQRPFKPRTDESYYAVLKRMGLIYL